VVRAKAGAIPLGEDNPNDIEIILCVAVVLASEPQEDGSLAVTDGYYGADVVCG